jgi:glycolate oxidase
VSCKEFGSSDIEALRRLVADPSRIIPGDEASEDYSHDELGGARRDPDAVAKVVSTEEVSAILAYASKEKIPVTPRGSGTGLVGGAVPVKKGIVLDLSLMDKILELDEDNLTITVQAGVLLMDLAQYAADRDFLYPPDPGEKTATIGGNISTNAGGMRAVKYGVTRDFVRGLEVVLPSGEVMSLGGKIVKNSSGYSLMNLIIGSEGTLAVVTKATLKLLPLPPREISLLVPYPTLKQAIETVPLIIKSKAAPNALEFLQNEAIEDAESYLGSRFPDKSSDSYLLLRFDGRTKGEIEEACDLAAQICIDNGALDVFIMDTEERSDSVWKARGAFLEAIKSSTTDMDEVDVVTPRSRVDEMVSFTHSLREKHGVRIKTFGHAGDGNLHAYILKDDLQDDEWSKRLEAVMEEIYEKAKSLDGQVSGEHGIGFAKRDYLKKSLDPAALAIMKGIKAVFDPGNILNPDKII